MAKAVSNNAQTKCSFGAAPGKLMIQPLDQVNAENQAMATIMDFVPMKNIMDFGMCSAPTNPTVIAAQGAPQKCVPVTVAPWVPGALTVIVGGKVALNSTSKCMCTWMGVIEITNPGPTKVEVP